MRLPAGRRHFGRFIPPLRTGACVAAVVALSHGFLAGRLAEAQTAAAPITIWSFLGVPNPLAMNAVAQQSANPAIAAAAKAKAAKHEIHKKKAALRYLAGIGCTPEHPEVMPALMAAMDDPDEQVRYEAVKAVLETAEACQSREQKKAVRKAKGFCESCADWKRSCEKKVCEAVERLCGKLPPREHKHHLKNALENMLGGECEDPAKEDCPCADRRGSCCGPDMRDKLMKLAYGRDDLGCFLEPSKRVRDLAELALNACNACACACEGTATSDGDPAMDYVVREMPPEDGRETRPSDSSLPPLDGPCFDDRVIEPPRFEHHELIPTPAPLTAPEEIPPPSASTALPAARSVLVRVPSPRASAPLAATHTQAATGSGEPAHPHAGATVAEERASDHPTSLPASHTEFQPVGGTASDGRGTPPRRNPLRVPVLNPLRQPTPRPPTDARRTPPGDMPTADDAIQPSAVEPHAPTPALAPTPASPPRTGRTKHGFSRRTWAAGSSADDAAVLRTNPGLAPP